MKKILIPCLLVLGVLCLMLQSKSVRDHFAHMAEEKLELHTGLKFTIKDWRVTLPLAVEIREVECKNLKIENLFIRPKLLAGKWVFDTIAIEEITLDKEWFGKGGGALPPSFEVAHLQINKLRINDTALTIDGGIKWNSSLNTLTSLLQINNIPLHFQLKKNHLFAIAPQGSFEGDLDFTNYRVHTDHFTLNGSGTSFNLTAYGHEIGCEISGPLHSPTLLATYNDLKLTGSAHWDEGVLFASLELNSPKYDQVHLETQLFTSEVFCPYSLSCRTKKIDLQSVGAWKFDSDGYALFVDSLEGEYAGFPFALKETAMIRNHECSPLSFALAGGTLYATIDSISDNIHTTLRAKNLPSELFELWLPPLPFTSSVDIEAFLNGSPKSLNGQIQLDLGRMKVLDETYVKLPPLNAHCLATLKEEKLECSGTIIGAGPYPMTLSASLPFKCQLLPPKITIDQKSPIRADLTASGEISPYLQLFYSDTTNITGQASIALSVDGTLENPQMAGELTLENGTFESYTLGTLFENISAKIVGRGPQAKLLKFSADTHGQKSITATGSLMLEPSELYPFTAQIHTHNAPLLQLDLAQINASGPLQLKGNIEEATISGDLTVERANFELPKNIPPSVKEIEISYINQPDHEEPPTQLMASREIFPITLDIRVHAPKGIYLTGNDLITEWRGEASIKGPISSPQLFGQTETIKGELSINGKKFDFTQGNITFNGNYSDKATLYVIAAHEIEDTAAEIVLKGPVNNPRISFRSNPPLTQPEILSLILFNKQLPEITSHQGAELNQTFSTLNSSNEPDILSKLRKTIGIDRLEFSQSDNNGQNEITLQIGKYVTPGILVLVNKSMTSDAKSLVISANLIKSFKLQAEIDEGANGHLLLKWKHDY